MNSFEEEGIWWLPENPDNYFSGILKFDPVKGAKLELTGSFDEDRVLGIPLETDDPNKSIILGVISRKEVTLHKCYEFYSSSSSPGIQVSHFDVRTVYLGHHFEKEEDIKFNSISVNYSNLNEWVGITGFKLRHELDSNGHFTKFNCNFQYPEKIDLSLDDLDMSINYSFIGTRDFYNPKLKQTTLIELYPNNSLSFKEFKENILYYIQNFLSLGIGKAIYPLQIKGKNEACKIDLPDEKTIYKDIEIYYRTNSFNLPEKTLNTHEMFFSLRDIEDSFEECLNNWFRKADALKPAYDLYFATLYNSSMYLEHNFLSLAQAIESYHRRLYGGEYMLCDDYKDVYDTLMDAIPDYVGNDHKQSLRGRIRYGNEFSFRTRLKKIFENLGENVTSTLIADKNSFINKVVNMRNYLTHYDKSLEDKVNKDEDLHLLTIKLKFIMEVCFLLELGIPSNKIEEFISRDRRYGHIKEKETVIIRE
jgi:hypothetical protein